MSKQKRIEPSTSEIIKGNEMPVATNVEAAIDALKAVTENTPLSSELAADLKQHLTADLDRWEIAQKKERELQNAGMSYAEGLIHFNKSYENYFKFVGLGRDLSNLVIVEVGAGDFPALHYCHNFIKGIVVDPLPSETLQSICENKGLILVNIPFENAVIDDGEEGLTEVWFFNLLQHVADPNKVVEKAKQFANRIRFFEPINEPITEYHIHTFSIEDYQNWFGQVNLYKGGTVAGFHTADCAYGIWHRE